MEEWTGARRLNPCAAQCLCGEFSFRVRSLEFGVRSLRRFAPTNSVPRMADEAPLAPATGMASMSIKSQVLRRRFLPFRQKARLADIGPEIVGVRAAAPGAGPQPVVVLHCDQPQVLRRQFRPLGLEARPVGIDPQVVAVGPGTPHASPQRPSVHSVDVEIDEPQPPAPLAPATSPGSSLGQRRSTGSSRRCRTATRPPTGRCTA